MTDDSANDETRILRLLVAGFGFRPILYCSQSRKRLLAFVVKKVGGPSACQKVPGPRPGHLNLDLDLDLGLPCPGLNLNRQGRAGKFVPAKVVRTVLRKQPPAHLNSSESKEGTARRTFMAEDYLAPPSRFHCHFTSIGPGEIPEMAVLNHAPVPVPVQGSH